MKRLFFILMLFLFISAIGQEGRDQKGNKVLKNIPAGYENLQWGSMLTNAKDKIKGKLYFTDDKTIIISKDGDMEYHYGFFYIDPSLEKVPAPEGAKTEPGTSAAEKKETSAKIDEGKLFYVALRFAYLHMNEVLKKIEDKYGPYTNENMINNQGAIAWNGEKTIVIMWVDRYENKPYCRRITYVSKEITKELNAYHFRVFNRVELELIKKLTP